MGAIKQIGRAVEFALAVLGVADLPGQITHWKQWLSGLEVNWWLIGAAVGLFFLIEVVPFLVGNCRTSNRERRSRTTIGTEWDALAEDRRLVQNTMHRVFNGDWTALIDRTTFPLPESVDLYDWCDQSHHEFDGNQKALWEFVFALIPEDGSPTRLLEYDEWEQLFRARRNLAKFWDRIGRHTYLFRDHSERVTINFARRDRRLIVLLSWLEFPIAVRDHTEGPGKEFLFRICRSVHRTTKRQT